MSQKISSSNQGHSDIAYVPLDLPKIKLSFNHFLKKCYQPKPTDNSYCQGFWWVPLRTPSIEIENFVERQYDASLKWKWTQEAIADFPEIKNYMETHLPFNELYSACILNSQRDIGAHRDDYDANYPKANILGEPSCYRILLSPHQSDTGIYLSPTENLSDTIGFLKNDEYKKNIILPENVSTFVMNDSLFCHGSNWKAEKLVVYITGEIDLKRHQEILKRSQKKFKSFVVSKNDMGV